MDLISTVRPDGGWYALLAIKDRKSVRQSLFETREEFDAKAQSFSDDGWDVYFGLGKFVDENMGRIARNVSCMKSFFVDIDCGESKAKVNEKTGRPDGYATQVEGLKALNAFCSDTGLPVPIIVNSGNGIHAYWALEEEVPLEVWKPIAEQFKQLIISKNFYADPAVPSDAARVLRVPGTYNFRYGKKLVEVRHVAAPIALSAFSTALGYDPIKAIGVPKKRQTAMSEMLKDNLDCEFAKIMRRSAKNEGCAQILDCYVNRASLAEPRWFNALSIAKFCSDRDKAIHQLSAGHPDYDYGKVEQKAAHIKGPHSCSDFEANNPGGCEGCPHKGKITNPLALGKITPRAAPVTVSLPPPSEPTVEPTNASAVSPVTASTPDGLPVCSATLAPATVKPNNTSVTIPAYPWPYSRGKNGGIYFTPAKEDATPQLVYDRDLYVVGRMHDSELGDCVLVHLILPKDGLREFMLTNATLSDKADLRKKLAEKGVVLASDKTFIYLMNYLNSAVREWQDKEKADMVRVQFGWADADSAFVLGDLEITHDGVYHSPVAPDNEDIAAKFHSKGTFDKWKEVFNLYGKEGMEGEAFGALTAFGSPLLKFTGHSGAIINLVSSKSGTGKTTVLRMVSSVYGHPKDLCASFQDTQNAKIQQLGIMNNLCVPFDELTNLPAMQFSELAYAMSQGRGKHRLEGSTNKLRLNNTTWQLIGMGSSNSPFFEKLAAKKSSPEGELMRVFEYTVEKKNIIPVEFGRDMFDKQLLENYGHAGTRYIEWIVPNLDEVKRIIREVQGRLDSEIGLLQEERFWSAVVACNIAGGLIAKQLGLLDWNLGPVYHWAKEHILVMRNETKPPAQDAMQVVYDYLLRNQDKILVVDDGDDLRTKKPAAPRLEPKGQLLARIEPDTKHLWLLSGPFKRDCVEMWGSYSETIAALKRKGLFVESKPKRISKGMTMDIGIGVAQCLCIDISNSTILENVMGEDNEE